MLTANAKRHSLGGAAGEFRVKQRIQLRPVAGGERGIESAGEIGGVAVFHPESSFSFFCREAPAQRIDNLLFKRPAGLYYGPPRTAMHPRLGSQVNGAIWLILH
jgi:hypothetical protein